MVPVKEWVSNWKGDRTKEKNTAHRKTAMKQTKETPRKKGWE